MRTAYLLILWMVWGAVPSDGAESNVNYLDWGRSFAPPPATMEYQIPQRVLQKLPKTISLFSRAPDQSLPVPAVEWVIDRCITDKEEAAGMRRQVATNAAILKEGRTFLKRNANGYLLVNPGEGEIRFFKSRDFDVGQPGSRTKAANADVLEKPALEKHLCELLARLQIDADEIEKSPEKETGVVYRDRETFPPPARVATLVQRDVNVQRTVDGFPVIPRSDVHEILLSREISGEWSQMQIRWPRLERKELVSVSLTSNSDLERMVKSGQLIWDRSNEVNWANGEKIVVTEVRLGYLESRSGQLVPVLLLDADLKRETGDHYVVLLLPII